MNLEYIFEKFGHIQFLKVWIGFLKVLVSFMR